MNVAHQEAQPAHTTEPRSWPSNLFFHPAWTAASQKHTGDHIQILESNELVLAVQESRWRWGTPIKILKVWENPFVGSGQPYAKEENNHKSLADLLKTVQRHSFNAEILLWPNVPLQGSFWDNLEQAADDNNMPPMIIKEEARAICTAKTVDAYEENLSSKKQKSLRKIERRLEERGWIHHAFQQDGTQDALERFLTLEASGWKGKRGTALACRQTTRSLIEDVEQAFRYEGAFRIDEIWVENTLAASIISFAQNHHAALWKMTYNEQLEEFSLGTWLLHTSTKALISDGYTHLDALTCASNNPIMRLWNERERNGTILLGLTANAQTNIERWAMREKLRHRALSHVKDALRALRD